MDRRSLLRGLLALPVAARFAPVARAPVVSTATFGRALIVTKIDLLAGQLTFAAALGDGMAFAVDVGGDAAKFVLGQPVVFASSKGGRLR